MSGEERGSQETPSGGGAVAEQPVGEERAARVPGEAEGIQKEVRDGDGAPEDVTAKHFQSVGKGQDSEDGQAESEVDPAEERAGGFRFTGKLKDCTDWEFRKLVLRKSNNGEVDLQDKGLTDLSMRNLAGALQFESYSNVTELYLSTNDFGNEGLAELAKGLRGNSELQTLILSYNPKLTTLEPLGAAGELKGLALINAAGCPLSGSVLNAELTANLPNLSALGLSNSTGKRPMVLDGEALALLPPTCKVSLHETKTLVALALFDTRASDQKKELPVEVSLPASQSGRRAPSSEVVVIEVPLPTARFFEQFGGAGKPKPVEEILEFVATERFTVV